MYNDRLHIAIIEPSDIIYEGLFNLLMKNTTNSFIHRLEDLDKLNTDFEAMEFHMAIINPRFIENRHKEFARLKNQHSSTLWVALVYAYIEDDIARKFQHTFKITDDIELLIDIIHADENDEHQTYSKELSEREVDVLKLLTQGLSNKEIADKLFISTHTVISHRKNIVEKTGIKSLPGLTIYAISKNITSINQKLS